MKLILAVDPIRYPLTGIGRYTLELAQHLNGMPEIEEMRYFSGVGFVPDLPAPDMVGEPGRLERIRLIKRWLARNKVLLEAHRAVSHTRRARALSQSKEWLFHGPNFYLPKTPGPSVVTMHDLSVFTHPQFHPKERVQHMHGEIRLALKRATMLIAVSQFARKEIASHFDWPLERVGAAPLGASSAYHPRSREELQPTLSRLGLEAEGYTLFTGTLEPRKNLDGLLAAYEQLPQALRMRFPLILAGYSGWNNEAIVARLDRAKAAGWARHLGFVAENDLPALFAGARAFAFPSHYEGFGLPVLEAMASGAPVVTADVASLPEVAGDAAALCEPTDIEALAAALHRALEDEAWRAGAREKGLAQAARFSWQQCANDTVSIYKQAMQFA
ncbi:glycosyltransferase WbpY [Devosia pacifica]|uniref:Glycosyltransferase WbpY n=1 Tax=Devosia pacifica TaxID=1335967 RepID=A0A918SA48_9HYPH|nr:glycosyltransferase family 1 protein [Devosia pacifica]GHA32557.1 glycosyltransferase WbpY [Devosia pacifica]